ncbi:MAG TPA: Sua5/YciO/YrdC/YwlC family protein [Oculatellaceae cyanobacterium]|jgi:tRNA A37 threonylcarbamoyladenosine synthetase subunit TsaC/SUA5/YrdC
MDFDLLNAVSYLEKPDGIIAAPFRNRYLLLCRFSQPEAVGKLFRLSRLQRERQPILLGYDYDALRPYWGTLPEKALRLMQNAWPGALIIRLPQEGGSCNTFESGGLGMMQTDNALLLDMLALQPGGILLAVDACRDDEAPAQSAEAVYNTFGDDVDFVFALDERIVPSLPETIVSIEADGSMRILRSGEVVID